MSDFKQLQRDIYNQRAAKLTPQQAFFDCSGFKYPVRFKEECLRRIFGGLKFKKGALLLDIGCGSARILNKICCQYGTQGVGIDIAEEQIRLNQEYNPFGNKYCVGDAENLPFPDKVFDYIICLDVLEHLPRPQVCLREAVRVLKGNGVALFYAISKKDRFTWHWFLRKITGNQFGVDSGADGQGDHDRQYFIDPKDIASQCRDSGFRVSKVIYIHAFFSLVYDELIVRLLQARSKAGPGVGAVPEGAQVYRGARASSIVFSYFNRLVFYLLVLLDLPWSLVGHSNGFFLILKKQEK